MGEIPFAINQHKIKVTDEQFTDILDKWVLVEYETDKHLFLKHFFAFNPRRKKYMLMQLVISDFSQGIMMECVFEGHPRMKKWVEQVVQDGVPFPKLSMHNGCFDVLYWDIAGSAKYFSADELGRSVFIKELIRSEFVTEDEINKITRLGVLAQDRWLQAKI